MKREDLTKLYKAGLISSKPYNYMQIKDKVSQYIIQGITKTEAVKKTAELTGFSTRTIWIALKSTAGINLT